MFLRRLSRLRHHLKIKLTLWYTGVLTLTLLSSLLVLYRTVETYFEDRKNDAILSEYKEFRVLFEENGVTAVQREANLESQSDGIDRVFFRLLTSDGRVVAHSNLMNWSGLTNADFTALAVDNGKPYRIETVLVERHKHYSRILTGRLGTNYILQIGHSLKEEEHFLEDLREILAVFGVGVVLVGLLGGGLISWRATAGINDITKAARNIADGHFDERVSTLKLKGEIETLAVAFNTMLDRIQTLITGMQEVTDNIAHDLRSPITRIRTAAELALHGTKGPEEYTAVIANTIGECDRLLGQLETMLLISEIEYGTRTAKTENVDLRRLLHEACDLFQPIAEDKQIALSVQPADDQCFIRGETAPLQRMIANLLDNALKYTSEGGRVAVEMKTYRNEVVLIFKDNGIGISEENLPHIFERFYRCDKSRHQRGSGLGLSLVRAIVQDAGGGIDISSRYGHGTLVTVSLPRRAKPQSTGL
jgi:heavy metal sensor kinase